MKIPALIVGSLVLILVGCEQKRQAEPPPPPATGRYEIVQFRRATGYTFKLDTWTGHIWQFDENMAPFGGWRSMQNVCEIAPGEAAVSRFGQPEAHRYEIVLSNEVLVYSFVVDTVTGLTCQLEGEYEKPRGTGSNRLVLTRWGLRANNSRRDPEPRKPK